MSYPNLNMFGKILNIYVRVPRVTPWESVLRIKDFCIDMKFYEDAVEEYQSKPFASSICRHAFLTTKSFFSILLSFY